MIHDIDKQIELINDSLEWAKTYDENFPKDTFKAYRRELKTIRKALSVNCSAAAYGESQVGKSYLMSSLLSSASSPFVIQGVDKEYSFIDDLNPSGGANAQIESTGVITRFTIQPDKSGKPGFVRLQNLSVVDLILMLVDSYYNDIIIDTENGPDKDKVNRRLQELSHIWSGVNQVQQTYITEDDIRDIVDYTKEVIGNNASSIHRSNFVSVIAPVIQFIPPERWKDIFSLLWNENPEFDNLFQTLINAYSHLNFQEVVYVPFDALLAKKGTLLKVQWLDKVCGVESEGEEENHDEPFTDVYDVNGNILASSFPKGELSALIAEITFHIPATIADERPFLKEMDLLDFPGARSRESYKESDIKTVIPKILRRGKVAYLFNKYSRALQISSMLFCHHNHQKNEDRLGDTIITWLEKNIGDTPESRAKILAKTNGISPLFFVATKFNLDLEKEKGDTPDDLDHLEKHWERFNTVIPEIFDPSVWLYEWTYTPGRGVEAFQNIYPLRDFYWSAKRGLFIGYSDKANKSPEIKEAEYPDFPDYMARLRESFLNNKFVRTHFANPEKTWLDVATLNNDGSKPIIANLNKISGLLDGARKELYKEKLKKINSKIREELERRYVPDDIESKNKKVKRSASGIKQDLTRLVGSNPMAFGKIIDRFMMGPEQLRNIAYEIIELDMDRPVDFSKINFIKANAHINSSDSREENIEKLLDFYFLDTIEELEEVLEKDGFTLDEVLSSKDHALTTEAEVVTKHIVDAWKDHLEETAKTLQEEMPNADIVSDLLKRLFQKLGMGRMMSDKISRYIDTFEPDEQSNVIGDYASLTLNNFVSTVGRAYITDAEMNEIKEKAETCRLRIDFSSESGDMTRQRQPLIDTLKNLDQSTVVINDPNHIDISVLDKLPFWRNYKRWLNFALIGLVCTSDIVSADPECNAKVKSLLDRSNSLYNV